MQNLATGVWRSVSTPAAARLWWLILAPTVLPLCILESNNPCSLFNSLFFPPMGNHNSDFPFFLELSIVTRKMIFGNSLQCSILPSFLFSYQQSGPTLLLPLWQRSSLLLFLFPQTSFLALFLIFILSCSSFFLQCCNSSSWPSVLLFSSIFLFPRFMYPFLGPYLCSVLKYALPLFSILQECIPSFLLNSK